MIRQTGTLICANPDNVTIMQTCLPDRIRLSRAVPEYLIFEVTQTTDLHMCVQFQHLRCAQS